MQLARRWLWLLVAATALAALSSYVVSIRLPKVYEGSAKLLVTPSQGGTTANYNDILTAERLTTTYSQVIKTRPVVEAAARHVGIAAPFEQLAKQIDAKPVTNTQLIQVSARAGDPELAARFANELVQQFVAQTQANQSSRYAASKDALGKQVDQLNADLAERTRQVDALRADPTAPGREADLSRVQNEITQLQQAYAAAVRSYEDVRVSEARGSDLLSVAEPAFPPLRPVQPKVTLNVLLAAVVGCLITAGIVFLVENFDDRLLSPERIVRFTGLHVLGTVPILAKDAPHTVDQVEVEAPVQEGGARPAGRNGTPRRNGYYAYGSVGSTAESFRLLRANLQFASVERSLKTLLITSCDAGDGKSTTAANLAVVVAQAGQRVLLVDADLRRPTQHEFFAVENRRGLTSLLVERQLSPAEVIVSTRVDGLSLLPSGPLPPNPSELLASARMRERLLELRETTDLVILDTAPVAPVSDPAVLAGAVDGVLLVVDAQRTRGQHAAHAIGTLQQTGANLVGVVLNRVRRRGSSYGYATGYGYTAAAKEPVAT